MLKVQLKVPSHTISVILLKNVSPKRLLRSWPPSPFLGNMLGKPTVQKPAVCSALARFRMRLSWRSARSSQLYEKIVSQHAAKYTHIQIQINYTCLVLLPRIVALHVFRRKKSMRYFLIIYLVPCTSLPHSLGPSVTPTHRTLIIYLFINKPINWG